MGLLGSFLAVQGFKVEGGKQAGTDKVRQIMKRETSAAVKIKKGGKNMPHCLLVSLLPAMHWCLRKEGEKKSESVCDPILLFSLWLVIRYFLL